MDKLSKFLKKLNRKERVLVEATITSVIIDEIDHLDVKKLKGHDDVFRIKVRDIRIIFQKRDGKNHLIEISRRNEQTYKKF